MSFPNESIEIELKMDKILSSVNIAEELDDEQLAAIGSLVVEGYTNDLNSRQGWENKIDEWTDLALQVAEAKTTPWPGAANVKFPLITQAALQFSSRAYPALIKGPNIVRGRVIGFDDDGSKLERAIRVGKHMSYQLMEEMDDWEEQMDRLLFALPIVGCMFKKTYYDSVKEKNVSEVVYPKELVVNYFSSTLEDSPRITHILDNMSSNDVRERVVSGIYLDQELQVTSNTESTLRVSDRALGTQLPQQEDSTYPYNIIEQIMWMDLDDDDYKEPYVVTVDVESRKVLRIVARFGEESITYTDKGEIVRIEPDHYYTKYSFIPSPDGSFYDIGFGVLLGPISHTVNTLLNQLIDAGTLSNMQSGFIARGIRIKGGNRSFIPGEWKYVNTAGEDLRKGIVPMPTKEPSNVLFQLLNLMITAGKELSSSTEIMGGNIPGQNTKATVAMAAIDQGMKVFMSIHKRGYRSLSKEFKKLFKLNSLFLPMEGYFTILDIGQEKAATIAKNDYNLEDTDIVPTSDPNVATEEQRMAKVQALFELLQLGTVNPQEVTRRYLEATEQPNIEVLMKMPEPRPNPEIEFDKIKFKDESERGWEDLAIRRITAEAGAIKNYADAEAAEEGQQLDQYAGFMKMQQEDDVAGMKSQQAAKQFQQQQMMKEQQNRQQMGQKDQAHMQKMAQQEQMGQMKMRQQATQGGNNAGTTGTNGDKS